MQNLFVICSTFPSIQAGHQQAEPIGELLEMIDENGRPKKG